MHLLFFQPFQFGVMWHAMLAFMHLQSKRYEMLALIIGSLCVSKS